MPLPNPSAQGTPVPADLRERVRRAHVDHLPRVIRLRDGVELTGVVTAVIGGEASEMRVKVVASHERARRWLRLRDIEAIE